MLDRQKNCRHIHTVIVIDTITITIGYINWNRIRILRLYLDPLLLKDLCRQYALETLDIAAGLPDASTRRRVYENTDIKIHSHISRLPSSFFQTRFLACHIHKPLSMDFH